MPKKANGTAKIATMKIAIQPEVFSRRACSMSGRYQDVAAQFNRKQGALRTRLARPGQASGWPPHDPRPGAGTGKQRDLPRGPQGTAWGFRRAIPHNGTAGAASTGKSGDSSAHATEIPCPEKTKPRTRRGSAKKWRSGRDSNPRPPA